jgi:predicted N-acetyltransferase YhbS
MTIDALRESDLGSVHILLRANGLPLEGFDDHFATALVAREGQRVIGSAALEMYAPYALLRSVAVDVSCRGQGIGPTPDDRGARACSAPRRRARLPAHEHCRRILSKAGIA